MTSSPVRGLSDLPDQVPVLIAGGGPSGLMSALDLDRRGIRSIVIEPRADVDELRPRAKTTNARTMTLLHRLGLADRIRAAAPLNVNYSEDVAFCTGLAGHELRRFEHAFQLYREGFEHAPQIGQQIPQPLVERVLRDAVRESEHATLATGLRVSGVRTPEQPVATVEAVDGSDEASREIRAQIVIGADGGASAVRRSLGIELSGTSALRPNFNVVFRSRSLAERVRLAPAVQYWVVGEVSGMIGRLDLEDRWWTIVQGVDPASCEDTEALVRRLAGVGDDLDVEVLGSDPWTARMLLAPTYGSGRVFLVGDAAHLNPPWGGHGFNTCVVDALNLTWKIAGVLRGWADPTLLGSYEAERRPVARWMIDTAASNGSALAYDFVHPDLDDSGAAGETARADVHDRLAAKDAEFHAEGLVLGYHYHGSPIVSDGELPEDLSDAVTYRGSAHPGSLLPHLWLADGTSAYDLLGADFTVLSLTDDAVEPDGSGVPLHHAVIPEGDRVNARERWGADWLLVRPDQHVAWRGDDPRGLADALHRSAGHVTAAGVSAR